MAYKVSTQSITALAALFQSASLVHTLASRGIVNESDFEHCINSLFITDPKTVSDIYSPARLKTGLGTLEGVLNRSSSQGQNFILRYVLNLTHLEIKLQKNNELIERIRQRIRQIAQQKHHFEKAGTPLHHCTPVIASLAELYRETISTLSPKIHVIGQPRHLQTDSNADKIRALLLAGIRAATLWRQLGGKRWHFIFFRKHMLEMARKQTGYGF